MIVAALDLMEDILAGIIINNNSDDSTERLHPSTRGIGVTFVTEEMSVADELTNRSRPMISLIGATLMLKVAQGVGQRRRDSAHRSIEVTESRILEIC